jgi:hypothetical protein
MKKPDTNPDAHWLDKMPQYRLCVRHGKRGVPYDTKLGCPLCQRQCQSLMRYGPSNTIDAPVRTETRVSIRLIIGISLAVALLAAGFALAMHRERPHLDGAVARIERAGR